MNVKMLIRADATRDIGTGHVMRCLALACSWKKQGGEIAWVTHCDTKKILERIKQNSSKVYELSRYSSSEETIDIIGEESPDCIVLDGYQFDTEYQKGISECGIKLLVIDDYAHLDKYYADIILNQNFGADKFKYNALPQTKFLFGTDYVMLRSEFFNYRGYKKEIKNKAENILVTMGGADAENHTSKMLDALNLVDVSLCIKVPIGANNPHLNSVKAIADKSKHNIDIIYDSQDMPALMQWADVAISAGGTTTWELLFMGVPSVLCITTDNQEDIVNSLNREGMVMSLGWIVQNNYLDIVSILQKLIANKSLREELNNRCQAIVDGMGTERVVEALWQ